MDANSEAAAHQNAYSALSRLAESYSAFIGKPTKDRLPSPEVKANAEAALVALGRGEPAVRVLRQKVDELEKSLAAGPRKFKGKRRAEPHSCFEEWLVGQARSLHDLVEGLRLDKVGVAENGDLISCPNGFAAERSRHWPESLLRLDLDVVVDLLRERGANGEAEKLEQLQIHLATNHNRVEKCLLRLAGLQRWENRVKDAPLRTAIQSALQAIVASRGWAAQQAVVEREMESARWSGEAVRTPSSIEPPKTLAKENGPLSGCRFGWNGKTVVLPPTPFKVVEYLYNAERRRAHQDHVAVAVWGDETKGSHPLDVAMSKANSGFSEEGIPISLHRKKLQVWMEISEC